MDYSFDTRAQLAAIEQIPREYPFLLDTFVKDGGCVEDDKAIYDYRKKGKIMAPFIVDGAGGIPMGRDGYSVREIGFPTIAPERVININDIATRQFGEKILGASTPAQRAKKQQAADLKEMLMAIDRRKEWMARQILLTGKLEIFRYTNNGRDKETTLVADYGFTNNFTPSTAWSSSGSTISDDMRRIKDMIYEGGGDLDLIVCAPDVAEAMVHNAAFMKEFDYKNADMGKIKTSYRGSGLRYWGQNSEGVDMYSYTANFTDDEGNVQQMIPSGKLIAGGRQMINMLYGPVTLVKGRDENAQWETYIKKEVPQRLGNPESNQITNRITTRPTMVPFNIDAWVVADVL